MNCKKAYYLIVHSRIMRSLEMVQVSVNIVKFIRKLIKNWNAELKSCKEYLNIF